MAVVTALNSEVLRPGSESRNQGFVGNLGSTFNPGRFRSHTASAAVRPSECWDGFLHNNDGAAGAVVLSLPSAEVGMHVRFLNREAQNFDVNPDDLDQIEELTDAAGDAVRSDGAGEYLELMCVEPLLWAVVVHSKASANLAAPTQATYVLDMTGDTPADTDTFTINGRVYTVMTTVADRYDILVNATPATQAANIVAAFNGTGTPGTEYDVDTYPDPEFSAAAVGDTVVFTARVPGTAYNSLSVSTDITGATFVAGVTAVDQAATAATSDWADVN
jgi:hypothetical protein